MKHSGETWVEKSPYNPKGFLLPYSDAPTPELLFSELPTPELLTPEPVVPAPGGDKGEVGVASKEEAAATEEVGVANEEVGGAEEEVGVASEPVPPSNIAPAIKIEAEKLENAVEKICPPSTQIVITEDKEPSLPAEDQTADISKPPAVTITRVERREKEGSESPNTTQKKMKVARRRVTLNVPPDEGAGEEEEEEEKKEKNDEVVLRRKQPTRSQTISCRSPKQERSLSGEQFRRQSLVMLKKGHTGERGSRRFRAALKRDSIYEGHPGWESIRKLSMVVG